MSRRALGAALVLAAGSVYAQATPDEQARRLLEDGRTYMREGKHKQALDNFTTIASGFANTELVDDALLEIGLYRLEVDRDLDQARAAFELVTQRYPQSDGAAGAYYRLGRMSLDRAVAPNEIDDAIAQFERVERLYPRSDWVPRALLAASEAHRKAGRLSEAVDFARRVPLEFPSSDAAPGAQFHLGQVLALAGDPRAAMEEFQQVRNRWGQTDHAARALDRITALFRLFGEGKPRFAVDPAFGVGAGDMLKDVRALLVLPDRTTWIASDKANSAAPYGADGRMGAGYSAQGVRTLAVAPGGLVVLASERAVRFGPRDVRSFSLPPAKEGEEPKPLEKIEAAVLTPGGSILVADEDKKKVFRFDARNEFKGPFPDARERRVTRMLIDGEGAILMLDREAKSVLVLDEFGKVLRTLGPRGAGYELRKPADVAVDVFRNVYLAEEDGGVLVFSPRGDLLATIGAAEARKPKAVAVDPSGAVLVYDGKLEKVVRFR